MNFSSQVEAIKVNLYLLSETKLNIITDCETKMVDIDKLRKSPFWKKKLRKAVSVAT